MSADTNNNAYRDLAKLVVDLQKRVDGLSTSQLGHSSLENTRINTYDGEGRPVGAYGRLPDGTYGSATLSGPTPPTPSGPQVESIRGIGLKITWDGVFAVATDVVPLEGGRLEVYVSTSPDITGATVPRTTIESPRGGEALVSVSYDVPYYVAFAFRASSGKLSEVSGVVGPYGVARASAEDLDIDLDALRGTEIFYGPDEPVTDRADLWLRGAAVDGQVVYTALRFDPGAGQWVEMQDQGVIDALQLAAAADQAARTAARIFHQTSAPTGLTADDVNDLWVDIDDSNVTYTWDGGAWVKRQIGTGAIVPNSLVASDVIATGTISAALLEAILVLATTVVAGNPIGTHVRIDQDGVVAYADDPVDGIPNEIGRFGRNIGIRNSVTGELVANIDENGQISAQGLTITNAAQVRFGGITLSEMEWDRPWGNVGYGELKGVGAWGPRTDGELGYIEIAFEAQPGRDYELVSEPIEYSASTGDTLHMRVRRTVDGTTPMVTSSMINEAVVYPVRNTYSASRPHSWFLPGPPEDGTPETWRMLLTVSCINGSTGARISNHRDTHFWVKDVGPKRPDIGVASAGGGTVVTGTTPPPPPPPAPKVTKTETHYMNWSRSWRQNGSFREDIGSAMYQGYGDSFNGVQGGAFAWHDVTGILSGATVNKAEVFLYCEHAWYNTGVDAIIRGHGTRVLPTTFPPLGPTQLIIPFGKPEGKWVTLPASWANDIKSGILRGLALYINGNNPVNYGRFAGVGTPNAPRLRITYTK